MSFDKAVWGTILIIFGLTADSMWVELMFFLFAFAIINEPEEKAPNS